MVFRGLPLSLFFVQTYGSMRNEWVSWSKRYLCGNLKKLCNLLAHFVVPYSSSSRVLSPQPFLVKTFLFFIFCTKKVPFDDFFMTNWEWENVSERKKEPQILRLAQFVAISFSLLVYKAALSSIYHYLLWSFLALALINHIISTLPTKDYQINNTRPPVFSKATSVYKISYCESLYV